MKRTIIFLVLLFNITVLDAMNNHLQQEVYDDAPGMSKYDNYDDERFSHNEMIPGYLPTIAIITLFERADLGIEGKMEHFLQGSFQFVVKRCIDLKNWFMKD